MGSRLSSSGGGGSTTDASTLTTGTLPLARLSGITTSQIDAAAGITSAQIAALDAAKITTGTLPLARLSGLTTSQLSASAALGAGQIASVNPSTLTGSGTVPLAALSGITTSQLAAGAAITSGQIASVAASTITGTNTLPDGVLSTNVPLLGAANTFTALQTIAASVAGPLAQINNSSTTGAGLVIGGTTVASAGAGKIAPALALTQTVPATANYGLLSIGGAPWDGSTSGKFAGSVSGTGYAGNFASGYGGSLMELQVAGVSKLLVDATGKLTLGSAVIAGAEVRTSTYLVDVNAVRPYIDFSASSKLILNTRTATQSIVVQSAASQTADPLQIQDSASHVQFGLTNRGSGGSPIWALKVRAVANAESAAQAHTIGAATGKAIEVMDDAGASLGWIALYA